MVAKNPLKTTLNLRHLGALAGIIALGAALRFWQLDAKPLWLDEIVTALLSLGLGYGDVPTEVVSSPSSLQQLFTLQPGVSCPEIAHATATQSTHPPLFFCFMHQWLQWLEPVAQPLAWKLRALPALLGVGAITALYFLNRLAFSPAAGLMGAAVIAVSPFGVYLSQEARQYSLLVLLITLSLLGLVKLQQELYQGRQPSLVWLGWGIVNSLGCYVHYFYILAFAAQIFILVVLMAWQRWRGRGMGEQRSRRAEGQGSRGETSRSIPLLGTSAPPHLRTFPQRNLITLALVILGVGLSYLPWLPILIEHFNSPKTSWLSSPQNIAPLYQMLVGWLLMVIALPVEDQPLAIQIGAGLLMLAFGGWVGWKAGRGLRELGRMPQTKSATLILGCFTACVLLQFLGIIYLLDKDITVAPRYNYVYYPAICALLGASFCEGRKQNKFIIFIVGLVSCVFVVFNLAFQKPYTPMQVAQNFNQSPSPLMVIIGYNDSLDLALGLSYALSLDEIREIGETQFAFLESSSGYNTVWQKLSELSVSPKSLWIVAPGLERADYPPNLALKRELDCTRIEGEYYRIGIPYQLYRCPTIKD
ncbi:MAG: hypothetical protein BRC38_13810 [Cyanobacteria bacterium QH_6_48_35]|nr:MAG: hypothetical protein BRC34_04420 [Cyanobacteria bacterium QH_1_48_107]PSO63341.1 MAG: hypothetical protein BRC38_13810 [Cyanobacteria bacterium QH_6_48_35]PSO64506.1 MAG: hypothetical protein BRC39_02620 [Cyanobacteria bacterium QH_7_48_89]